MRVPIDIDSRIRIPLNRLGEKLAAKMRETFTYRNPKRGAMQSQKIRGWWNEPLAIATWSDEEGCLTFPRGGMSKVRELLMEAELEFGIKDSRRFEPRGTADFDDPSRALWPHQERIVQACIKRENCLVRSATASGKTSAIIALLARLKVPTIVIVHSNALAQQWVERAVDELGMREKDVGLLGGGKSRVCDLTVGTVQSIAAMAKKDPEFLARWSMVVADEVHLFAARTFFALVDQFPARWRVGVSDDDRRKDRMEFLIHDLFGEVILEVGYKELVDAGHVMDVELMVVPTEFRADWYGQPAEEGEDKKPEFGLLLDAMMRDDDRNELVRRILRTEMEGEGRQVLAMTDRREHCQVVAAMAASFGPSGFLVGGPDYAKEFLRTRRGLKAGKIRAGIGTYQATGTGTDLPGVEIAIGITPMLSNRGRLRQARGRVARKPSGKTVARLYALWDQHVFGERHLRNAAAWNQSTFVWDGAAWIPIKAYLKARHEGGSKDG